MNILFCILEKLGSKYIWLYPGFLKELVDKTIGASVCGVEQAVATMITKLTDAIDDALKPIMDDWIG